MKPVQASIDVPQPPETVYDFLDVLANHELFTDHMFRDWTTEGPAGGVGAKARFTAVAAGRSEPIEVEVVEAERPVRTMERNVGGSGRVATGTYTLAALPGGGTRITFVNAFEKVPRNEALAAPLVRVLVRRGNQRALTRLAAVLREKEAAGSGT